VVLLTLGLGIGANTAIFTLVDALLLRTLPVPHPEQLIVVGDPARVGGASLGSPATDLYSYPLYRDLRDGNQLVSSLVATGRTGQLDVLREGRSLEAGEEPDHPRGRMVSGNYFAALGVRALLGRTISEEDDVVPGGHPVVVVSHRYWQQKLGGSNDVLGRNLIVNGSAFTIIGVMAPEFAGEIIGQPTELWMPLMMQQAVMPNRQWLENRNASWLLLMGRLAPGITLERARAEFNVLTYRAIAAQDTEGDAERWTREQREHPVRVGPGDKGLSALRPRYAESLTTLMAAVTLVLLVVCANVANLLFARGAARGKEISVRLALGADRLRLVRQLLTESVLLAILGGVTGVAFAWWGSTALLRLASAGPTPIPLDTHLDWRVLGFTAGISLLTGLVFGLAPALRATRINLATDLRFTRATVGGLGSGPGRRFGIGKVLVMLQIALSLMLLVGTSMLVRSAHRLENVDVGVARDQLLIVTVDAAAPGLDPRQLQSLWRTLLERAHELPGVAAASFSENGIFSGSESQTNFHVEGFTARSESDSSVFFDRVGPAYVHAIGARLLEGRDIGPGDDERAPPVLLVNRSFADFYYAGGSAIGRYVRMDTVRYQVVGVIADTRDHSLRDAPERRVYLPLHQTFDNPPTFFTLELRTAGDPARLIAPVRDMIQAANASLRIVAADPLTDLMRQSISQDRLAARVASVFGMLALALAALGLYGVMTYATQRRTSEFGLRIALGAQPRGVRRMVLAEALILVVVGGLTGLPLALAATRLLQNQLFEVGTFDPASLAIALAVLAASAALAAYLPAARAARVGPLTAMRAE
jgi:predicted permease